MTDFVREIFRLPNSLLAEGNSLLIGVDFRGIVCGDKEPIRRLSVVACCLIEERQLGGNRFWVIVTALQQGFGDSKTECSSARRSQRLIQGVLIQNVDEGVSLRLRN